MKRAPMGETPLGETPLEMIASLGLTGDCPMAQVAEAVVSEMDERKTAFAIRHLGFSQMRAGDLLTFLEGNPSLQPPRSGHLGDWRSIFSGVAGPLDYNYGARTLGRSRDLIYAFTQTESDDLASGDGVYRPGSSYRKDTLQPLPLYTWDGRAVKRRGRERPWFCPFAITASSEGLTPLISYHKRLAPNLSLEAEVLYPHRQKIREILIVLIEGARSDSTPRPAFQELFSHGVTLAGEMKRITVEATGAGGFKAGAQEYRSSAELAKAALLPLWAAAEPEVFFENMRDLPTFMPMIANTTMRLISALLSSHYVGDTTRTMTSPFNPHLHWGARGMAGLPPTQKGYLLNKTKKRYLQRMAQSVIAAMPELDPVMFIILPATIFLLCPRAQDGQDTLLVDELLRRVQSAHQGCQQGVVTEWFQERAGELSAYFLSRFYPDRGQPQQLAQCAGPLVIPDTFRAIPIETLCHIVAVLMALRPTYQEQTA